MQTNRKIDHIVYTVPNLEAAMDDLKNRLGIRPTFGGYHQTKGTKNALLNLGNSAYLEILAIDLENTQVTTPRWMGVDTIQHPQITRWAILSEDLVKDSLTLQTYHTDMGFMQQGSRQMTDGQILQWNMILPLSHPTVELVPFMIDWRESEVHPTEQLESRCHLLDLELTHPQPSPIQQILNSLDIETPIMIGNQASIRIQIASPKGKIWLG